MSPKNQQHQQQSNLNMREEEEFDEYHEVRKSSISSSNFSPNFYDPFEIKHRRRTSRGQFKILEKAFTNNPKPNAKTRKELAESLSMTPRGVQVWFQNRRAKAKQQQDNNSNHSTSSSSISSGKSHDSIIDDLQVSSPIVFSSSDMVHTRSQSSSSSTSFSINQPASASASDVAAVNVSPGIAVITINEPQLPIPSPNPIYYGQKGWFSDGASTGTDEMISSSSPLLLTPPQQKQQDEYSWMIDDVSGIMDSHPTLFNNQTTGNGSHNTFQNVTTEDDPLDAWAYIESLEISNNENQFMHTSYNRNVDDWISSTTKQASHNDLFVMLDQQRSRQPLFEQNEQIMRRLSEPSDLVNSYYNIV